jgi:hypothetical protein
VLDGRPLLFDIKHGYIQCGNEIAPGEYWLLVPEGQALTSPVIYTAGRVALPGKIAYRACRVLIETKSIIAGYAVQTAGYGDLALNWIDDENWRMKYVESAGEVFSGKLPPFIVNGFKQIEESGAAMFYTAGNVSGKIKSMDDLGRFLKKVNSSQLPVTGRILICTTGRSGESGASAVSVDVDFTVLPPGGICFADRIYAFNEEPVIEVDETFPGFLQLAGCRRLDRQGKKWAVPLEISRVTGTLECRGAAVPVDIPLYRARIYDADGRPVRYFLLHRAPEETLLVTGRPGATAVLGLWQQPGRQLPLQFDSDGRATIASVRLQELVRDSNCSINEVVMTLDGFTVSTGTILIEYTALFGDICSGKTYRACTASAGDLLKILDLCRELCRGGTARKKYKLSSLPRFDPVLDEQIMAVFACAEVLDDVEIMVSDRRVDWAQQLGNTGPGRVIDCLNRIRTGQQVAKLLPADTRSLPPVQRWQDRLEVLFSTVPAGAGRQYLQAWATEVCRLQHNLRSEIARLKGGQILTGAWIKYRRGQLESALATAACIEDGPPLIRELQELLRTVLLLRLARVKQAAEALKSVPAGDMLQQVFALLKYAVQMFNGQEAGPVPPAGRDLLACLPLRQEDSLFLEQVAYHCGGGAPPAVSPEDCRDWLLLWFLVRICTDPQRRKELAGRFLTLAENIPLSPERKDIVEYCKTAAGVK